MGSPQHLLQWLPLIVIVILAVSLKWSNRNGPAADRITEKRNIGGDRQTLNYLLSWRHNSNRIIWVVGAIGVLAINEIIEKIAPSWHLSNGQKMALMWGGIVLIIVLGVAISR